MCIRDRVKGGQVMGVVNVVGSTIARTCGSGVYVHSGPEIAVASTKAFTSQMSALMVFTLKVARSLMDIPQKVATYLAEPGPIDDIVEAVKKARYVLFLGRGFSYPVALE